jgi:hypothetical protein
MKILKQLAIVAVFVGGQSLLAMENDPSAQNTDYWHSAEAKVAALRNPHTNSQKKMSKEERSAREALKGLNDIKVLNSKIERCAWGKHYAKKFAVKNRNERLNEWRSKEEDYKQQRTKIYNDLMENNDFLKIRGGAIDLIVDGDRIAVQANDLKAAIHRVAHKKVVAY